VMAGKSSTVKLDACPAWIMPNAGARGYYRSALARDWLRKIVPAVVSLDPAERIALISDEWAIVRAGQHDVGDFLGLASGFKAEMSAAVTETLTATLGAIDEYLTTEATRPSYRRFVKNLLRPALDRVNWSGPGGEGDDIRGERAAVVRSLGGTAHDSDVLSKSRELVLQELDKPGSVEPTLLNVVVGLAALEGDAALYDKYLARSKAARDPEEHYRYLNALTSFPDPALVRRTLDHILGPDVRSQDAYLLIASLVGNPDTQATAWPAVQQRWDEVQKKGGGFSGLGLIVNALASFCDAAKGNEIRTFFSAHPVPEAERTLQQSIERINSCSALASRERPNLARWLEASSK